MPRAKPGLLAVPTARRYREDVDSTPVTAADADASSDTERPVWQRLLPPVLTAGVGIGTLALLHFRDPHVEGSYGLCPVYALAGVYCPGCGGMRAIHNLTDGRVLDSLHSNVFALPLVLAFVVFVASWSIRAWRGQPLRLPGYNPVALWVTLGVLAGYTVLRNTPWGTWLTPV